MKVLQSCVLILLAISYSCSGLSTSELYNVNAPGVMTLQRGDDETKSINLQHPIHFYTEKYDSVYINTNGLLTFTREYAEFINIPFPIDNPSISPFYSNIDTTHGDSSSVISYYETTDAAVLSRASHNVRTAFSDAYDFSAQSVFVATWSRVPKWLNEETQERNRNEVNTFQVAVISDDEQSYVEFLYPQNGIQWIQAENGQSGLPDIRARAGFVAHDGRFTLLKGSGSDRVRHLPETSNFGQSGRWIYRVGKLGEEENVVEPDNARHSEEDTRIATSCADGGRLQCHSSATCEDSRGPKGFCCKCRDEFYGNGYSCIKNSVPIRVIGSISGHLGSHSISGALQAYVVMNDGRIYAAISSMGKDLGTKIQLLQVIGGTIGWLFAKPFGDSLNGYQITGGKFNHSSTIRFNSGENVLITQRYTGLNLWDQLSAEIEIAGDVPDVHEGITLTMEDFFDEYKSSGPSKIQVVATRRVELSSGDPDLEYTIYQDITYERCDELPNIEARLKTSRIQLGYYSQEDAVRLSSVTKIGVGERTNPCIEGTANCGDNTICVPNNDDDSYECQCKNGFTFASNERDSSETCVDIDECSGSHICSEDAECFNTNGGYTCVCLPGYEGNGYECRPAEEVHAPHTSPRPSYPYPSTPTCRGCSENAHSSEGVCVCNSGFIGNGYECRMICAMNEMFDGVSCVRIAEIEEDDVTPQCTQTACFCPHGYDMVEFAFKTVCRVAEPIDDLSQQHPISCDVVNNCHRFANCEFDDHAQQYQCVCSPGYDGNGIDCIEIEANCAHEDICDVHAECVYNSTVRRSSCICADGYEGNGRTCRLSAECRSTLDCGYHSVCIEGICECDTGYERDSTDLCVPSGSCNGAYCANNAYCRFDDRMKVNYCFCPEGYIGDGVLECKSIPPACNVRNNCGLYASCVPNYRTSSYQCLCNDGYNGDGFVCVPEHNCNNIPELCDANAHCAQNFGKYQCVCNQGYVGNGSTCNLPPKLESEFLIVSQGVAAVKVPLNSGYKRGVPIATATMVIAIDKDCIEGRVYWSDIQAKAIYSSKYDGTDKKTFLSEGIMSPEGIAIDWVGRKIYWADSLKDTIEVASLDNATIHSVLINQGLVNPRGLTVDPMQGKLFWSDWNRKSPKIESSNLDGSDRKVILSAPDVKLPNSLALSISTGELCYADAGNQKIECIDTYTNQQRLIADKLSYPFSLAITDSHVYWSDWNTKKIESIDTNGNRESIPVSLFTSKMYGMTSVTDHCPFDYDICSTNNGDCPADHICLANRLMPSGKTCKCVTSGDCNIHTHE